MKDTKKTNTVLVIGIIAAVVVIAAIAGYILLKSPSEVPSTQSNTESAASANTLAQEGLIEASIENSAFVPSEIRIKAGSKITWTNYDNTMHTVTSDSGGKTELNSGILAKDEAYGHVFNGKGVFNYHCTIHPGMKGKVVVE